MCTENHFSSSLHYNSESDSFSYNSVEPIIIASIVLYFLPAYPKPAYNYIVNKHSKIINEKSQNNNGNKKYLKIYKFLKSMKKC